MEIPSCRSSPSRTLCRLQANFRHERVSVSGSTGTHERRPACRAVRTKEPNKIRAKRQQVRSNNDWWRRDGVPPGRKVGQYGRELSTRPRHQGQEGAWSLVMHEGKKEETGTRPHACVTLPNRFQRSSQRSSRPSSLSTLRWCNDTGVPATYQLFAWWGP